MVCGQATLAQAYAACSRVLPSLWAVRGLLPAATAASGQPPSLLTPASSPSPRPWLPVLSSLNRARHALPAASMTARLLGGGPDLQKQLSQQEIHDCNRRQVSGGSAGWLFMPQQQTVWSAHNTPCAVQPARAGRADGLDSIFNTPIKQQGGASTLGSHGSRRQLSTSAGKDHLQRSGSEGPQMTPTAPDATTAIRKARR